MRARSIGFLLILFFLGDAHAASPWCTNHAPAQDVLKTLQADADRRAAPRPRAIARVHTEGTLPHQGIWDQSVEAKQDLPLIRDLTLLWQARHDAATLARLGILLDAWADVYQPSFNPIDETNFDAIIDAYAVTGAALPEAVRDKVRRLVRTWGEGYIDQMQHLAKPGKGTWINNWQSHRIKLASLAAVALDDARLLDEARAQFLQQLGQNLLPDGSTIDLAERDALHYTVYDLEPLARSATAAASRGEDWLHLKGNKGASLGAALDWLVPYAQGKLIHEEYVHTTVKFDRQRQAAGLPGFSGSWDPKTSGQLFWLASKLEPRYAPVARSLMSEPSWIGACWQSK